MKSDEEEGGVYCTLSAAGPAHVTRSYVHTCMLFWPYDRAAREETALPHREQ